jgi:hypothetical protein
VAFLQWSRRSCETVAEDHATRFPDERHRGERDQPVTGADVEHHLAVTDASVLQNSVSDRYEEFERPSPADLA